MSAPLDVGRAALGFSPGDAGAEVGSGLFAQAQRQRQTATNAVQAAALQRRVTVQALRIGVLLANRLPERRVASFKDALVRDGRVVQQARVTAAGHAAMVDLQVLQVRRSTDCPAVLQASLKESPQALVQLSSPLIHQASPLVAGFALRAAAAG